MKSGVIVAIAIVVLLAVAGWFFFFNSYDPIDPVCAQDVQECSDGSFVSRNPNNNCEFFACPVGNEGNDIAHPISIVGFAFSPATITINAGEMVGWINEDSAQHTVTSDSGSEINSPYLSKGETYSHVFMTPGTFNYHCAFHSGMSGTVIVR